MLTRLQALVEDEFADSAFDFLDALLVTDIATEPRDAEKHTIITISEHTRVALE